MCYLKFQILMSLFYFSTTLCTLVPLYRWAIILFALDCHNNNHQKSFLFSHPPEKRIWLIIRKFPWFHRRQESWNRHIKKYWKCPLERAQSRAKFLPSFVTYDGLIWGAIKKWPIESFLHVFKTRLDFTKAFVRK